MRTTVTAARSLPEREVQALREVGRTDVTPRVGAFLTFAFVATISAVSLLQAIADRRSGAAPWPWPRVSAMVADTSRSVATANGIDLLAVNRGLRDAIDRFETRLENESVLHDKVRPPIQRTLTGVLRIGNEKAYLGRDSWLFYREDIEHVTGRGFLEPAVLRRAGLAGNRTADPLPALVDFRAALERRGIRLIVMPTPVKPTLYPERFNAGADPGMLVRNPSFEDFVERLEQAQVSVFDPAFPLAKAKLAGQEPLFLRSDTHWTPAAVEITARALAGRLAGSIPWNERETNLRKRPATVEGIGDTATLLGLPSGSRMYRPERVEVTRIVTDRGEPWRPSRRAEIVVLGDSFTNVYSDPSLGWGAGAGLAEILSLHLRRPVDRIAVNDGGARSSRQALARALESDPERLQRTLVVIYQFANRELSTGDWDVLPLPTKPMDTDGAARD